MAKPKYSLSIFLYTVILLSVLASFTIKATSYLPSPAIISCECVAFRFDDVQDFFLNKAQMAVMDTFSRHNASLTLGIIGAHFGEDDALVKYINNSLLTNSVDFHFNIANHGWEHEDFSKYNATVQSSLIKKTNEKLSSILGATPSVFVPPYNLVNRDTFSSLVENKIQFVSANLTTDPLAIYSEKSYKDNASSLLYHFPSTGSTGDLSTNNDYWVGREHQEILADIEESLENYGFAVVTMHPMEYSQREALHYSDSVDLRQVSELKKLINDIKELGLKIVTIPEIKSYMN